jgi:ribonuclease R
MPDKMRSFATFAHNMGLDASGIGEGVSPRRLSEVLTEAEEKNIAECVSGVMLRSLSKAKYSENAAPHYGLALKLYAHFTSPIRRYPDLFVHRAITSVLTGSRRPAHPAESARVSSEAELRAVTAERGIEDLYMAQYASFHLGEEYEAQITSVCSFGVFARTDKLFEGLIPIEALFGRGARPDFDEDFSVLAPLFFGLINANTKSTPSAVEKTDVNRVGRIISVGAPLPIATRTATSEVGKSCKEVAFKTKNIADENSAFSVLSKS